MGILTKIKQRPEGERKIFSLVSAAILTLIIFIAWLGFGTSFKNKEVTEEENKLSSISPTQVIKDEFSKAFSNFKSITDDSELSSSTIPIEIVEASTTASTSDDIATSTNE